MVTEVFYDVGKRRFKKLKPAQRFAKANGGQVINSTGYDVTKSCEPGEIVACSVCGVEQVCSACETDDGCAPVCHNCYERQREEERCPCCGQSRH